MKQFSDHMMASESNQVPSIRLITVDLKQIPVPMMPAFEDGEKTPAVSLGRLVDADIVFLSARRHIKNPYFLQ